MELIVKPVRFGDCCILRSRTRALLIDCGSANVNRYHSARPKNAAEYAYLAIKDEIDAHIITDVAVTHFDLDHFNGLLNIPQSYRFENAYLPFCIVSDRKRITKDIAFLITTAPASAWGFQLSEKIVQLFLMLARQAHTIHCVQRADPQMSQIPFGRHPLQVLWPDVKQTLTIEQMSFDNIEAHNGQDCQAPDSALQEILAMLPPDTAEFGCISANSSFSAALAGLLDKMFEDNTTMEILSTYAVRLEEAAAALFAARAPLLAAVARNGTAHARLRRYVARRYHNLIRSMNALSIVCHIPGRLALLGDATPAVIEALQTDFSTSYTVVKAPHHGTTRYYTHAIPSGEYLIVSNGGYRNRPVCREIVETAAGRVACTRAYTKRSYCQYAQQHGCADHCVKIGGDLRILLK